MGATKQEMQAGISEWGQRRGGRKRGQPQAVSPGLGWGLGSMHHPSRSCSPPTSALSPIPMSVRGGASSLVRPLPSP